MSLQNDLSPDDVASGRWADEDPAIRLQAVHVLGKSGPENQQVLAAMARDDTDAEVRNAAVSYLNDIDLLAPLRGRAGPVQDTAELQYLKVLSGSVPSALEEARQLELIRQLDPRQRKQVALQAKSKTAGLEALAGLSELQDLSDITLFAASIHVRKAAATRLTDPEVIADLLERLGDKDRSVGKILAAQVNASPAEAGSTATKATVTTSIAGTDMATTIAEPAVEEDLDTILARADALTDVIRKFATEVAALGPRNTARLTALLDMQRDLLQQIRWPRQKEPQGIVAELKALQPRITELTEQNRQYQQELLGATAEMVDALKQALNAGMSAEAIQAWDKLQGVLSNLAGKQAKDLRRQLHEFRGKINELKDWKNFAGTEKKKELIQHMQHLLEAKMNPPDRARQINALHKEWKALGRTSQNEKLWREFKSASDAAYEPCKEYFRQQKQMMAENFRQRSEICNQLEAYLQQLDPTQLIINDLVKIEEQARSDWQKFAPVEQSKVKKLQKRFYDLMDRLRNLRRDNQSANTRLKSELVAKAEQLGLLEDNRQAMNEARTLQAQWKLIGPGLFKQDRKLWEAFRSACDKIFQRRDEQKRDSQATAGKSAEVLRRILNDLDALHALEDEAFREARRRFADLQREFRESLDARVKKDRQQLLDRFHDAVRKVESRYRRLPDRKVVQLRDNLAQRASYCATLEQKLLDCTDDAAVTTLLENLDPAEFSSLPASGNNDYDQAIAARYESLRAAKSLEAIRKLASQCNAAARDLCVRLEIRANVSSPSDDQALRMQIQLAQLKNEFGKGAGNSEDNLKFARDMELRFLCLGPLDSSSRADFSRRVTNAVNRIG